MYGLFMGRILFWLLTDPALVDENAADLFTQAANAFRMQKMGVSDDFICAAVSYL
jgi:hypothetical protein